MANEKNFVADGDFRSVLDATYDPTLSPEVGAFWLAAATGTISGVNRGTYLLAILDAVSWKTEFPNSPFPDASLIGCARVKLVSPAALNSGDYGANLSLEIKNGVGIFAASRAAVSFWVYSTSRYVGLRAVLNFGVGSATDATTVYDEIINITPGQWTKVNQEIPIPAITTQDIRRDNFLSLSFGIDNVNAGVFASAPLFFVETSTEEAPITAISGVVVNRIGAVVEASYEESSPTPVIGLTKSVLLDVAKTINVVNGLIESFDLVTPTVVATRPSTDPVLVIQFPNPRPYQWKIDKYVAGILTTTETDIDLGLDSSYTLTGDITTTSVRVTGQDSSGTAITNVSLSVDIPSPS